MLYLVTLQMNLTVQHLSSQVLAHAHEVSVRLVVAAAAAAAAVAAVLVAAAGGCGLLCS
jgi:hypothetical protein